MKLLFHRLLEKTAETKSVPGSDDPFASVAQSVRNPLRKLADDSPGKTGGKIRKSQIVQRDPFDASAE